MKPFTEFCQHHQLNPTTQDGQEQYAEYQRQLELFRAAAEGSRRPLEFIICCTTIEGDFHGYGPFLAYGKSQDEIVTEASAALAGSAYVDKAVHFTTRLDDDGEVIPPLEGDRVPKVWLGAQSLRGAWQEGGGE
ncbi:hypothetical protein [Zobellella sp. An-6]|uniref:hypothetical protein n=1 Tax=Zobellella sp. An-6 TaxID=3400218 RepID=UPI0040431144